MKFKEAFEHLKEGKSVKAAHHDSWKVLSAGWNGLVSVHGGIDKCISYKDTDPYEIDIDDLLAEDWEIVY